MLNRTTVSINQDYLRHLKLLSLQKGKSLSCLFNEAVRRYLSQSVIKSEKNQLFFDQLNQVGKELKLTKKKLLNYISKGRI